MKRIKETIASDLKNTFANEVSKNNLAQGTEGISAINDMMSAIPQNEEKDMIKRKIQKSPIKKNVGNVKMKKPIGKVNMMLPIMGEEGETTEATASGAGGGFVPALFTEPKRMDSMFKDEQPKKKVKGGFVSEDETGPDGSGKFEYEVGGHKQDAFKKHVDEKWSEKYKKSIDCNNPKGFSQKAHCQGRKKVNEDKLKGGLADDQTLKDIAKKHDTKKYYHVDDMVSSLKKQFNKGIKVEMEHTNDKEKAKEIVMDHLFEDPNYYDKLEKIEKVEAKEATDSTSSGSYETTAAWSKSMSKKHWRGASKPQIPGGKFVQVKKKCKTFPYCNQGDIKALKIFENESVKKAIDNISKKHNISENVIKNILIYEYENLRNNK
jgi:hypothetical protein